MKTILSFVNRFPNLTIFLIVDLTFGVCGLTFLFMDLGPVPQLVWIGRIMALLCFFLVGYSGWIFFSSAYWEFWGTGSMGGIRKWVHNQLYEWAQEIDVIIAFIDYILDIEDSGPAYWWFGRDPRIWKELIG